jgi:uncharacterized membrane protein
MHWGLDLGGWLAMGLWILALLFAVWLLVGRTTDGTAADTQGILRVRLARGEISALEYERARDLLLADQGVSR